MNDFSPFFVMELLQRAKELEASGKKIIHMEIGESDMPTPAKVVDAALEFIKNGKIKYTPAAGVPKLRSKIAEYYHQIYAVDVEPERIFITPGASGAFLLAFGVVLNAGDEMMMADPCYPCNSNFVRFFGGKTKFVNVDSSMDYQLTAHQIKKNWTTYSKGVIVASPSNPTGTVIADCELKKVIKLVSELNGQFFSDEIYHGLIYKKKARTALEFSDQAFVINSFSKYFAMTGWRIGWLVVPESYIDPVERLAQNIFISTATHSQYAALAAFTMENLQELETRKQEFEKRRDFLYVNLLKLGFQIPVKPEGAFYIYANCSRFTDDSFQFAKDLLEQTGVAVTPGKDFGINEEKNHIRFAYTASIDKMNIAIERLDRFLCQ